MSLSNGGHARAGAGPRRQWGALPAGAVVGAAVVHDEDLALEPCLLGAISFTARTVRPSGSAPESRSANSAGRTHSSSSISATSDAEGIPTSSAWGKMTLGRGL